MYHHTYFIRLFSIGILLLSFGLVAFGPAPAVLVSGSIKDRNGKALDQVIVKEAGSTRQALSDAKGQYRIETGSAGVVLEFSKTGYDTKKLKAPATGVLNVVLSETVVHLEEVVVIGYGKQKKEHTTGAVHQLNGRAADMVYSGDMTFNTESYDFISENRFLRATEKPLSTFSIDVDAASYSNVRRFINQGMLPPAGAVRVEEMINYFDYDYKNPVGDDPFAVYTEMGECPWNTRHHLLSIGLQGKRVPQENLPPANLVFLVDVSGSMMSANKLPLVQESLKLLVEQLREEDRVAMVTYAGNARLALPSTSGAVKEIILEAIQGLEAGGSTAGGAGITMAYRISEENFLKKGNNRVVLCTDGDFNVGESSNEAMERLIEKKRETGVFLTVLGYGMGNYKDSKMQLLADKGNGNHAYIDGREEAKKVLVNAFGGTLFTIAKDVKLQVEFNPSKVKAYRLVGYENRMLAKEDFNNDRKDAGDLGSGHTVTALYEIIPAGITSSFVDSVDALKYTRVQPEIRNDSDEWSHIKLRYKTPGGSRSELLNHVVSGAVKKGMQLSENHRFASAVAAYGMLLRQSEFRQHASFRMVLNIGEHALGEDEKGYRKEFLEMARKTMRMARKEDAAYTR